MIRSLINNLGNKKMIYCGDLNVAASQNIKTNKAGQRYEEYE